MKRLVLTAQEARDLAAGTLTEIRRPVADPPRFWDFMDGLDGVARPTGYQCVEPSKGGVFIWSVDCRNPLPNRLSVFGAPGALLWCAETWILESGLDGARVVWKADRGAAWVESGHLGEVFYLDSNYHQGRWRSSVEMPRWASRHTLRLTAVHAERIGDVWTWIGAVERVEGAA